MPTYQYACRDCGQELEAVQSFTDEPLTVCPACGGTLRKRFSAVGVVFKGSGFYRTDSRETAKAGAKGNGRDSKDGRDSGKDSAGKKDTAKSDAPSSNAAKSSTKAETTTSSPAKTASSTPSS